MPTIDELIELGAMEKGKTSIADLSGKIHKDIAEAEAIKRHEVDRNSRRAKNDATRAQLDKTNKPALLGVTDPSLLSQIESGPLGDSKNFKRVAANDLEGGRAMIDSTKQALGLMDAPPAAVAGEFRKGTQTLTDGRQIPYFTNLQGAPGDAETDSGMAGGIPSNVSELEHYSAGAPGSRASKLNEWANSNDPTKRAVAAKLTAAEHELKYGDKSARVIGSQVAKDSSDFEKLVSEVGIEGATQEYLKKIESGDRALPVLHELTRLSKDKVETAERAEYEQRRQQVLTWARTHGAKDALTRLSEATQQGIGKPDHNAAIEKELRTFARSATSGDLDSAPEQDFIPATGEDVDQWPENRKTGQDFYQKDPFKPGTIVNPKGTTPTPQVVEQDNQAAQADLLDTVTGAPSIGAPARTPYSYTAQGGAPPPEQSSQKGPGYELGGDFWNAGPSAGEQMGNGPWGALSGAAGAIGEAVQGLSHAAGGRESPAERQRRLAKEAARRARG